MSSGRLTFLVLIILSLFFLDGGDVSAGSSSPSAAQADSSPGDWTWVSGSNTVDQKGVYGTNGAGAPGNVPSARLFAVSWVDKSGNFWLFAGFGGDSGESGGALNDLWKYDGSNWTWVSGSNTGEPKGVYGTKGVAGPGNVPGARAAAVSWVDNSGNFWLFGGVGWDSAGSGGYLNDLWKYDGSNWTWVSGSNTVDQKGVCGTKGVAAPGNVPGARLFAVSWVDKSGNFWLFGGFCGDSRESGGALNDLWKYDGSNWTWVSGSNTVDQKGVYGTKGVAAPGNVPGARNSAVSWVDNSGNFWLFGGVGRDSAGSDGALNDLWKYDGSNWTWVSGSNTVNQKGVYGTKGVAAPGNVPGAREGAVSWVDNSGNFWFFGGHGYASAGDCDHLNDLWKYDGGNWTWVSGSNTMHQKGSYGTKGVAAQDNVPGARDGAVSWVDKSGNVWFFGGFGHDSAGNLGYLNDLWRY